MSILEDQVNQEKHIAPKVDFELNEMQLKMIKIGGITNILTGLFVMWILKNKIEFPVLIGWYGVLVFINLINIAFSYYYKYSYVTPENIKPWLRIYHVILGSICLTWGSMAVLFTTNDANYQLYTLTFLQVVLFGFSFGTITDFTATTISIICLLIPYESYVIYSVAHSLNTTGTYSNLTLSFGLSLLILGIFLLITCYVGYRVIKKSYMLSFLNEALREKLEKMNKLLEQRVKERTLELEESLKLVTYQATHDLLTDLPNQRLLEEYIQSAIHSAKIKKYPFALICFSLNGVDKINDAYGHHVNELIIKTIAKRLNILNSLNKNLIPYHYRVSLSRKDVFIILIEDIHQEQLESNAKTLFKIVEEPITFDNTTIQLTASIGASFYPHDGDNLKSLLMNADAAMVYAKQLGGNQLCIYSPTLNEGIHKQIEIESHLYAAVKNAEFVLHYQPLIDLNTNQIHGAEALTRWKNPLLGIISPDDFIPLAESNGLIIPLGEWIFYVACRELKKLHNLGFTQLMMAINLSSKQLQQKNFLQTLINTVNDVGVNPKYIELELTEREAFNQDTIPILIEMHKSGFCLVIDDFGTGYSGLSQLKLLPINKIKIDKSFIKDLITDADTKEIVINTIKLAKKLKITVLAEGVETKEQLDLIKHYECDMAQGYYFSKPISSEEFINLLVKEKQNSLA